jgi:hypothetical protein
MRQFLKQLAAFWGLQLALGAAILAAYQVDRGAYMAANQDKQGRLAALGSPKIILVGGSSTAFGFDSRQIQDAFGKPVVNMGIQASLGLDYILREPVASIGKGDIVVASIEYELYAARAESALTIYQLLEQQPSEFKRFTYDPHLLKILLDEGHLYVRHVLRGVVAQFMPSRRDAGALRRSWHNKFGDVIEHRHLPPRPFIPSKPGYYVVDPGALQAITELAEICQERGARMFIFHPAVARYSDAADVNAYQPIYEAVKASTKVVQLNEPNEMMYDRSLFFDSSYHVNTEGIDKRTSLLISRLKEHL